MFQLENKKTKITYLKKQKEKNYILAFYKLQSTRYIINYL